MRAEIHSAGQTILEFRLLARVSFRLVKSLVWPNFGRIKNIFDANPGRILMLTRIEF